jgi:RNA polymerase sigma-70 factor (ECF subfamily)
MLPDTELVSRVRQGDLGAFRTLVERYQRSLLAVALAEVRDIQAAEDITQTVLLLAYRRLPTLRDGSKFYAWLMQIARRQIVEAARMRRVPVAVESQLKLANTIETREETSVDNRDQLLCVVQRLPEHERLLIGLRYFDGNSVTEIAEITGRPVGTVTKQLSRAHARLRAWLEEDER